VRDVTIVDCAQRRDTWRQARAGVVTATAAAAVMTRGRSGGESAARRALRARLVVERLTGRPLEDRTYVSADMVRGLQLEPLARARYAAATGRHVQTVGFVRRTDLAAGCSPDGVVGDDGGVEFKVPQSITHLRYLRPGTLPVAYRWQLVHSLFVTGAAWWDIVSFDPRFREDLQLVVARVQAADLDLRGYERELRGFLDEVDRAVAAREAAADPWRGRRLVPSGVAA
jgi:hypothetical protein